MEIGNTIINIKSEEPLVAHVLRDPALSAEQ